MKIGRMAASGLKFKILRHFFVSFLAPVVFIVIWGWGCGAVPESTPNPATPRPDDNTTAQPGEPCDRIVLPNEPGVIACG